MKDLHGPRVETTFDGSATALAEDECISFLESRELGRIAFAFDGRVEIFPVNYGMDGRTIVFRTSPGTKLTAVTKTAVSFEVDSWDSRSGMGWSVVARGRAHDISAGPGDAPQRLWPVLEDPTAPSDRWHWIAIAPDQISGRRFQVPRSRRESS